MSAHAATPDQSLDRLRRIEGQVRGLQHMMERQEPCTDLLTQIADARAALAAVAFGLSDQRMSPTGPRRPDADEVLVAVERVVRLTASTNPAQPTKALVRFASAHLRSPAAMAAYTIVAGSPDVWWSRAEMVKQTTLDARAVDIALRRFADAGVVETCGDFGATRRYRWHPAMRYLWSEDLEHQSGRVDPVCGMPLIGRTDHTSVDTKGRRVEFCSLGCRLAFETARPVRPNPSRRH